MATYNSAGNGNFNADATWTESGQPSTDDVAVIASGHTVTMTADDAVGSIDIQGTLTTDGTARTLTLDDGGQGYICENRGTVSTTINLTINSNYAGDRLIRLNNGGNGNFNNVSITLQSTSRKLTIGTEAASIDGTLTIAQGEFNTDSSNNYALTVTGATIVGDGSSGANTATLTCNASTISLGASYTADYALRVKRGGTFVGGSGQHTFGSFSNEDHADSITTLTTHASGTTLSSEYSSAGPNGYVLAVYDDSTFDDADGLVVYTGPSADSYLAGKTLHNVTINSSGNSIALQNGHTFAGNLTITAGTLTTRPASTTENNALTVAGTTTIGPNSGAEDQATLTCNASTISLGSGITSNAYGLYVNRGGTFVGGTGNHTIGSIVVRNVEQAKCTLTNATTTLNGEHGNDNRQINIEGANSVFNHNSGTVKNTLNANTRYVTAAAALALNNFEQDNNSNLQVDPALTCAGNFTLTAGEFDTSGSNYGLTVTKHIDITGTLAGNASAISTGTMTIRDGATLTTGGTTTVTGEDVANSPSGANWLWRQMEDDGTGFAPTAGTVHFNHASNLNGKHINESKFYNLTLTTGTGHDVAWTPKTADTLTIANDLTIAEGQFKRNVEANTLVVTADVEVHSGGILGDNDETGPNTFGSLLIDTGGTYKATNGTTTITAETSSHAWNNTGGTFTHNNGKVKIYDATGSVMGSTSVRENTFYDLEISLHVATYTCSLYDVSGNAVTILNNLDVTKGEVEFSTASDTITIHGLTNITADAKFCDNAGHDTNKIIHNGLVTNLGTYNINDGTTVKLNGGIRQLGTLTVK